MINASSPFNAVSPLANGTGAGQAVPSTGASAADAFAALLAELDPADLQTALGATPRSVATGPAAVELPAIPEPFLTPPSFPIPNTVAPQRPPTEAEGMAIVVDEEENAQELLVDPTAFLIVPTFTPPDCIVPARPPNSFTDGSSEQDECTQAAMDLVLVEEVSTVTATQAQRIETVAPVVAERMAEADARADFDGISDGRQSGRPADDVARAAQAWVPQQKASLEAAATTRDVAAGARASVETGNADAPTDTRRTLLDAPQAPGRSMRAAMSALRTEALHPSMSTEPEAEPVSHLQHRLMEAVRRVLASPTPQVEGRPEGQVAAFGATARPFDLSRVDLRVANDRLELPTSIDQGTAGNTSNRDQSAPQRDFTGTLAVHAPQTIAAASTSPVFALPGEVPSEQPLPEDAALARQIVQAAQFQWRAGGGDAKISLHPEYLGEVQIQIRVEAGTVTATLHASEPQVRVWMQAHEGLLKQGLSEQGLQLDKLDVRNERNEHEEDDASRNRGRQPEQQQPRRILPGTPVFDLTTAQDL